MIAELRRGGVSLERLSEASAELDAKPAALTAGAAVLVNGTVSIVQESEAASAIKDASPTLVYYTGHAISAVQSAVAST